MIERCFTTRIKDSMSGLDYCVAGTSVHYGLGRWWICRYEALVIITDRKFVLFEENTMCKMLYEFTIADLVVFHSRLDNMQSNKLAITDLPVAHDY
jgi:hypothetical protein